MFAWTVCSSKLLWHYSLGIFHTSGRRRVCAREDDTNPWLDRCQVQSTFPASMNPLFVFNLIILKLCWVTNSQLRDSCLSNSWRNCFDSATNGIQKLSEVSSGFGNFTLFWEHEARECHTVCVYRRSHDQPVVPTVNEQEMLLVIINNALKSWPFIIKIINWQINAKPRLFVREMSARISAKT